jgi:hypothetical protein
MSLRPVEDQEEEHASGGHRDGVLILEAWLCSETRMKDPICVSVDNGASLQSRLDDARDVLESSLKAHFRFESVSVYGHVLRSAATAAKQQLRGTGDSTNFMKPDKYEVAFTARGGSIQHDVGRARLHDVLQGYLDDAMVGAGILHASAQFCDAGSAHSLCPPSTTDEAPSGFPLMMVLMIALGCIMCLCCCCALVCLVWRRHSKGSSLMSSRI